MTADQGAAFYGPVPTTIRKCGRQSSSARSRSWPVRVEPSDGSSRGTLSLAGHEAAHIVTAAAGACETEAVTVEPGTVAGLAGVAWIVAPPIAGWRGSFDFAAAADAGFLHDVYRAGLPRARALDRASTDRELAAPHVAAVARALSLTTQEAERRVRARAHQLLAANLEAIDVLAFVLEREGTIEQPRLGAFLRELQLVNPPVPCTYCPRCSRCFSCEIRETPHPYDCRFPWKGRAA